MTRMVRKQLYIDEAQDAYLRREAARRGVTQADIMRTAIDVLRTGARSDARTMAWEELQSLWADLPVDIGSRYRFRREDAYETDRDADAGRDDC